MDTPKKEILIVEDEKFVIDALEKKLLSEGFDVTVALNGQEGLEIALKQHPDLILLDIVMPVMDGLTMLDRLRRDEWGKDVPVIVLSNLNKALTIEEIKEKGVNSFLVKTDWKLSDVVGRIKRELGL